MDHATQYLVAVPASLADQGRQAATTWDPAGAPSMFRNPSIQDASGTVYVYAFGWIEDAVAPDIQAAVPLFPGACFVAADTFEAALTRVGLARVVASMF